MTHIAFIEDQESSPFYGKELMKAVTIIETPPLVMFGIRFYKKCMFNEISSNYIISLKESVGIWVYDSMSNLIINSTILNNLYNIKLDLSSHNTIINNIIKTSNYGFFLENKANYNKIYNNSY